MRIRTLAAVALAAAAIIPVTAHASYEEECSSPIRILSGRGLLFDWGAVNCDYAQEPSISTSVIIPAGSNLIVRYTGAEPINGNKVAGTGSKLTYGTTTVYIKWEVATGVDGAPLAGTFDSQSITMGNADTVTGGDVTATVIDNIPDPIAETPTTTYTRIYKTVSGL